MNKTDLNIQEYIRAKSLQTQIFMGDKKTTDIKLQRKSDQSMT